MDLLDFDAQDLYFEREDPPEVQALINEAAESYGSGDGELPLLQAYLRTPESLNVLVALNRFYYYRHRLTEALLISEKALAIVRGWLAFPEDWRQLNIGVLGAVPSAHLTRVRLYLFTLKSIGFLHMRLDNLEMSRSIFEKLVELDVKDRIGAHGLLELVNRRQTGLDERRSF